MKTFVKWFMIIWFGVAATCQAFGQCEYAMNNADEILTGYQTVYTGEDGSLHLSLIQVNGAVGIQAVFASCGGNGRNRCLSNWSWMAISLSGGENIYVPHIGVDTCTTNVLLTDNTLCKYDIGIYHLNDNQIEQLRNQSVDTLWMSFGTGITGWPLAKGVKPRRQGPPVHYGSRNYNAKEYFIKNLKCLK